MSLQQVHIVTINPFSKALQPLVNSIITKLQVYWKLTKLKIGPKWAH